MADIPRHLAEPPLDTPMLDWWADHYDHVFIAYSPFFRVPGFHPDTVAYGASYVSWGADEVIQRLKEGLPEQPNDAPDDFEKRIKAEGQKVSWATVQQAAAQQDGGAPDWQSFARTVWLWTVHADRKDKDPKICRALDKLCRETGLYSPQEDCLPVILEPDIGRFLTALAIGTVTIWNEFRDASRNCEVAEFSSGTPEVGLPGWAPCAISCDDPKLLMMWSHDNVAGLICLSEEQRQICPPEQFFEGEYARGDTYVDWLNPASRFPRKPRLLG